MRNPTKQVFRRRLVWVLGCGILLFCLDYFLYPRFEQPTGRVVNRAENGLWLRYTWYFGMHHPIDLVRLSERMNRHKIGTAFIHVRGVDSKGRLRFHYLAQAQSLNRDLHRLAPNVHRIAWIYAGNRQADGPTDLGSKEVRRNMASEAEWLVRKAGFDGVQWDYEICPNGDKDFLSLLEETRAALPKGALLESAVPGCYPWPVAGEGWSESYYGEVAKRSDGIAVMAYDSGMLTPRSYVWWVSKQVVRVTKAVAKANSGCQVLLGVPTYKDSTLAHNAYAENLRLALIGVRQGLSGGANLRVWQGVAVFADYTTTERDWNEFDSLWPNPRF